MFDDKNEEFSGIHHILILGYHRPSWPPWLAPGQGPWSSSVWAPAGMTPWAPAGSSPWAPADNSPWAPGLAPADKTAWGPRKDKLRHLMSDKDKPQFTCSHF